MKRVYLPYWEWEEVQYNMWGQVQDRAYWLQIAKEFTGSPNLYGEFMRRVIVQWPNSCAHNLSNTTQNRQAWIGHAACALAMQCPEDIVRSAWSFLTEEQQVAANEKADAAIKMWEEGQCQNAA